MEGRSATMESCLLLLRLDKFADAGDGDAMLEDHLQVVDFRLFILPVDGGGAADDARDIAGAIEDGTATGAGSEVGGDRHLGCFSHLRGGDEIARNDAAGEAVEIVVRMAEHPDGSTECGRVRGK